MIAESQDVTRLTIELSAHELDKICKGALVTSTVAAGAKSPFLLEIYCAFPPSSKHQGKIFEDWDE